MLKLVALNGTQITKFVVITQQQSQGKDAQTLALHIFHFAKINYQK
jgi:hypothetical protein